MSLRSQPLWRRCHCGLVLFFSKWDAKIVHNHLPLVGVYPPTRLGSGWKAKGFDPWTLWFPHGGFGQLVIQHHLMCMEHFKPLYMRAIICSLLLLITVHYLSFIIYLLLFTNYYVMFNFHYLLFHGYWLLFIIHCLLSIIYNFL